MCGVSGLAFALGMYLPMELNSPLVLGAAVAWLLRRSSKDEALASARHEEGTLVASGFIAGGALVGVLAALLRFVEDARHGSLVPDLTRVPGPRGVDRGLGQLDRPRPCSWPSARGLLGRAQGAIAAVSLEPAGLTSPPRPPDSPPSASSTPPGKEERPGLLRPRAFLLVWSES